MLSIIIPLCNRKSKNKVGFFIENRFIIFFNNFISYVLLFKNSVIDNERYRNKSFPNGYFKNKNERNLDLLHKMGSN